MANITYLEFSGGKERTLNVKNGSSVMDGAVKNNVPGIVAECGGSLSCATCHVYVDDVWMDRVGPASAMEKELLEGVPAPRPNSRLSCQIVVQDNLDGLKVQVPESQY